MREKHQPEIINYNRRSLPGKTIGQPDHRKIYSSINVDRVFTEPARTAQEKYVFLRSLFAGFLSYHLNTYNLVRKKVFLNS